MSVKKNIKSVTKIVRIQNQKTKKKGNKRKKFSVINSEKNKI